MFSTHENWKNPYQTLEPFLFFLLANQKSRFRPDQADFGRIGYGDYLVGKPKIVFTIF